jgi:hypothetical protein
VPAAEVAAVAVEEAAEVAAGESASQPVVAVVEVPA